MRARIPMIDSGTLGTKGHVQVVFPDKTESYFSINDPKDTTEIPQWTLKMFPEEALHWVEWTKDLFMQLYNQSAKSYNKVIEDVEIFSSNDSDQKKIMKEALSLIEDLQLISSNVLDRQDLSLASTLLLIFYNCCVHTRLVIRQKMANPSGRYQRELQRCWSLTLIMSFMLASSLQLRVWSVEIATPTDR